MPAHDLDDHAEEPVEQPEDLVRRALGGQGLAVMAGGGIGVALSLVLSKEQLADWGWRVPFLAGIIIAPIGFYLRSAIDETPEFKAFLAARKGVPNTPLRDVASR